MKFDVKPYEALRIILKREGISSIEIAKATGIHKSHVSETLNGKRIFSIQFAAKLGAHYPQLPMLDLVNEEVKNNFESEQKKHKNNEA